MPETNGVVEIFVDGVKVGGSPPWVIPREQADIIKLVAACKMVIDNWIKAEAAADREGDEAFGSTLAGSTSSRFGAIQPIVDALAEIEASNPAK